MKLLVLSDLHMEFAPFTPDPHAAAEADVVVLAGDIDKGVKGIRWAAETFRGKPVVYVTGNHEFYGGHWDRTLAEMRAEAKALGIHFLENDSVEIDGLRFLGCSLWTDFEYYGRDRRHGAMMDVQNGMNDFKFIKAEPLKDVYWKTRRHRLTALHVLRRHEESLAWLRGELPRGNLARTVVVVHHAPRAESVPEIYTDHPLTPGYASRLPDELLLGAGLWIHGHIHDSCDYLAGRARVVCNPRGYLVAGRGIENHTFNPGLLLSVYRRGGGTELIVTHLNAPYGPVVQKEHLEQALHTGTLVGLPTGPAAIIDSLFVECDPHLILRCAQEIGAPVASVNKLYEECCSRVPTVRLPAWEDAVAHLFARPPTDHDMGRHYHLQKLGVRLKSLRKNRGLTQAQLANMAGVTRHAVGAVEVGAESTAIGTYARVAAALGWELDVSPLTRPTLEELPFVFPSRVSIAKLAQ